MTYARIVYDSGGFTWCGPEFEIGEARRHAASALRVFKASTSGMIGRPIAIVRVKQ